MQRESGFQTDISPRRGKGSRKASWRRWCPNKLTDKQLGLTIWERTSTVSRRPGNASEHEFPRQRTGHSSQPCTVLSDSLADCALCCTSALPHTLLFLFRVLLDCRDYLDLQVHEVRG